LSIVSRTWFPVKPSNSFEAIASLPSLANEFEHDTIEHAKADRYCQIEHSISLRQGYSRTSVRRSLVHSYNERLLSSEYERGGLFTYLWSDNVAFDKIVLRFYFDSLWQLR
jgi:hypothetical protein